MRHIASWLFIILVFFVLIPTPGIAQHQQWKSVPYDKDIILSVGSAYPYPDGNCCNFIVFHNEYQRRIDLWLIKRGELVDRETCYIGDVCYLGNLKIRVNTVFEGKESVVIWFDLLKIYGNNVSLLNLEG